MSWRKASQATSVFIDPLSIFNAASYAPITNSVAPGEFVTIFGVGLSSVTESAQNVPLPTTLGQVQVTVNGRLAPLYFVSPTQINLLIPYCDHRELRYIPGDQQQRCVESSYGVHEPDRPGCVYAHQCRRNLPAGIGPAAVLHADYSLVTSDNPAVAGETLQLYVNGSGLR